ILDTEAGQSQEAVAARAAAGYRCQAFREAEAALGALREIEVGGEAGTPREAVVFVADGEPTRLGTSELVRAVRARSPETALIVLVSSANAPAAAAAMRQGVFDYLTKPVNTDELVAVVSRAVELAALTRENRLLREQVAAAS